MESTLSIQSIKSSIIIAAMKTLDRDTANELILQYNGSTRFIHLSNDAYAFTIGLMREAWMRYGNVTGLWRTGWLLKTGVEGQEVPQQIIDAGWKAIELAAKLGLAQAEFDMFYRTLDEDSLLFDESSLFWLEKAVLHGDLLACRWLILIYQAQYQFGAETLAMATAKINELG